MSKFEIGQTYQPKYGDSNDRFTVTGRDDRYIYYTKDWVLGKEFRERYITHEDLETVLTKVWTSSNDIVE